MQDKKPRNKQRQRHGLWELYYNNGQPYYNGIYINGKEYGLVEGYWIDGQVMYKEYYAR